MLVRDLPFAERFADSAPNFFSLPLQEASTMLFRLAINGDLVDAIQAPKLKAEFVTAATDIDWSSENTLVQIGANDGNFDDPVNEVLERTPARALLVEPIGIAYEALSEHYQDRVNTQLANAALSADGKDISLFTPAVAGSELHSSVWTCLSEAQAKQEVKRNLGKKALDKSEIHETVVPTLTAADLLSSYSVSPDQVAVLACDTEGQDVDICNSFLDAGARPQVILFEQLHVPRNPVNDLKKSLDFLGYSITEMRKDVLAVLQKG